MKTIAEVSERLKERQKARGISQQELREAAGLARRTMTKVLSGEEDFKLSTLLAVADRLGLELELVPRGMGAKLGERPTEPKVVTRVSRALAQLASGGSLTPATTPASTREEGEDALSPVPSSKEARQ